MPKKIITVAAAAIIAFSTVSVRFMASADGSSIELPIVPVVSGVDSSITDCNSSSDSNETEIDIPIHSHRFELQSAVSADCIHSGSAVYVCSCGETYTEVIPATGQHKFGVWITQKSATCTSDGSQYRVCSVCKTKETRVVKRLGHSYNSKVIAPTYSDKGYTKHTCKRCGYSYNDSFKDKKVLGIPKIASYSASTSAVRLNWGNVQNASGYRVYIYDSSAKSWRSVKTLGASALTYRNSGLKAAASYKFRIRAYIKENGNTVWSDYSPTYNTVTKPSKTSILKPSVSTTALRAKWKSQKCSGYEVYLYKSGAWKRVKTVTSSAVSDYRITGLKKNTAYKVKVRAYMKDSSGKKIYGSFSSVMAVRTKS